MLEGVGLKITLQLSRRSGASVMRYLKMNGKSCLGEGKLNVRFTLWIKTKDRLDFWHWQTWRIKMIGHWMVVLDRVNEG